MKQLLDLPDELLISILRNFRGSVTLNEAWQTLRTCKKFYDLGQSIIIEHMELSTDTLMPFIWTIKAAPKAFAGTLSLTIKIDLDWPQIDILPTVWTFMSRFVDERQAVNWYDQGPCSERCFERFVAQGPAENQATQNLKVLAKTMSLLPNLQSFALIVDTEPLGKPWCRCAKSLIPDRIIASIIAGLPLKCTNIYIDTGGADQGSDVEIVANAVKAKMHTIQNLWLRLFCNVSGIFMCKGELGSLELQDVEVVAFQAWLGDQVNILDLHHFQRDGQDLWDQPNERRFCFEKWKNTTAKEKAVSTSLPKLVKTC